jgi:EpsD family peptidyl-prolyl cis-trans isomerase
MDQMSTSSGVVLPGWGARFTGTLLAVAAVLMAGCGETKDKPATQTAAKVNKEEITVHQINFALGKQRGVRPEHQEAARRQALERLIDQELTLQKSAELKLDRDPKVVQQIEAARRDIISRAYLERVGETAIRPTAAEVEKYYAEKPALFKERRIYNLQEIAIEATHDQVPALKAKLEAAKNVNEFIEYLKANDFRFAGNQAVRAAEQLPLTSLDTLARMSDGQTMLNPTPTGATVVVVAGSRSQPVDLQRASPAIEQFLLNERKRDIIARDLKALREAAKIEYVGTFAEGAAAPASAASDAQVNQGAGIK